MKKSDLLRDIADRQLESGNDELYFAFWKKMYKFIKNYPERKGDWITLDKESYKCSVCETKSDREYRYCPNCGTRMNA